MTLRFRKWHNLFWIVDKRVAVSWRTVQAVTDHFEYIDTVKLTEIRYFVDSNVWEEYNSTCISILCLFLKNLSASDLFVHLLLYFI